LGRVTNQIFITRVLVLLAAEKESITEVPNARSVTEKEGLVPLVPAKNSLFISRESALFVVALVICILEVILTNAQSVMEREELELLVLVNPIMFISRVIVQIVAAKGTNFTKK